jgi:hypothetical protein
MREFEQKIAKEAKGKAPSNAAAFLASFAIFCSKHNGPLTTDTD